MSFTELISAVTLLVDFLLGVSLGVLGAVVHGSRRENREYSLLREPPDLLSAGARVILGVFVRNDGYRPGPRPGTVGVTGNSDRRQGPQSPGLELDR